MTTSSKTPKAKCKCHCGCATESHVHFGVYCRPCVMEHSANMIDNRIADKGTHKTTDDDAMSVISSSFPELTRQKARDPALEAKKKDTKKKKVKDEVGDEYEVERRKKDDGQFVPNNCSKSPKHDMNAKLGMGKEAAPLRRTGQGMERNTALGDGNFLYRQAFVEWIGKGRDQSTIQHQNPRYDGPRPANRRYDSECQVL
ncbi:hypothetical protein QBC41DRAFT_306507 [Cercophora samala]|uniref:Uncharacterized protein n=1 Tax=Cercophora samala TaxID=330535 RepID=A0AA39Z5E3_9PEZI|nr:hypothetical protein QBC41DRAFT_306507 [Cercophora samala]